MFVCVLWGGEDGRHSHGKMRARRSNLTSVNWCWCVVVYAPTGPGASFSETPFSRPVPLFEASLCQDQAYLGARAVKVHLIEIFLFLKMIFVYIFVFENDF